MYDASRSQTDEQVKTFGAALRDPGGESVLRRRPTFGLDSFPEDPYVAVSVIGLVLNGEIEAKLREYGFADFQWIRNGFDADHELADAL
jgi:hypothetical protein